MAAAVGTAASEAAGIAAVGTAVEAGTAAGADKLAASGPSEEGPAFQQGLLSGTASVPCSTSE